MSGSENRMWTVPVVTIPVLKSELRFQARRIYCVGRNYAAHIREMGGSERESPFFFQKPTDSIIMSGGTVPYPPATDDFQHEIELVLAVGQSGKGISKSEAQRYLFGIGVGIDLTRRDLQLQARDTGRPWEAGKSFDMSAPISALHRLDGAEVPKQGRIWLSVNGVLKQQGDLSDMIWQPNEIVSHLSQLFTLEAGDLIYTGTPSGVGKLERGDRIYGEIAGIGNITIDIGR